MERRKPDARIGHSAVVDGAAGGAWTGTRPRENVRKVVKAALGLVHGEGGGTDGLDPCGVTRRVLQKHSSQKSGTDTKNDGCSPPRS